jgi:hypothetical protein
MLQFISYIKAAMFFVLAGASIDSDGKQPNKGSQNMYSEANTLIKYVFQAVLSLLSNYSSYYHKGVGILM